MMKKQILMAMTAMILSIATVKAQGGSQRKTAEERVKETMEKLMDLKLDKAISDQADSTFTNFFRSQQQMIQEMMAGGQPDRDIMKAQRQKLVEERDEKLKTIFTTDQYKKWKDEIEPAMRPQRGNRQQ